MESGLVRVRQAARRDPSTRFTALLHHVTPQLLEASFYQLKRRASPGVDGVTWQQYERELEQRIPELHDRIHRGGYRPQPSKRAWIPKGSSEWRPLGIAALEDKVVQQAIRWVLEQIYEEDFLGLSYGFRPNRNAHQALDALAYGLERKRMNWVLDGDIRGYFDAIDHGCLMQVLEHRIGDRRVLRLIRRWLKAGVLEDGAWQATESGSPQGAVISPLLANIYLHHVLDGWLTAWRESEAKGQVILVRYADDFVLGFQYRKDAERCRAVMAERFASYGLELHPEKTRLLEFGRFAHERRQKRGEGKPETFDFLGFTHYCGRSWQGRFRVKRRPMAKRVRHKLQAIGKELRRRRHRPVNEQGAWLRAVVQGWMNYYAVPDTIHSVGQFRTQVIRHWKAALVRRSQRGRRLTWRRMASLEARFIPRARIVHGYPHERFAV